MLDDFEDINQLLYDGKIILCPTDTIWGLSCDAFNKASVNRIFEIKKRNISKRLILLVDSIDHLKKYITGIHPRIESLIYYHLRPITIIYRANRNLPEHLISYDGTVAIRVTRDSSLVQLIQKLGRPLVSTSANKQGDPSPKSYSDINQGIINNVDYVFYRGRESGAITKPSLMIKYNDEGELFFLR